MHLQTSNLIHSIHRSTLNRALTIASVFTLALAIASAGDASAHEVHVAPMGDDSAPGTSDQPVRTLARAQDLSRQPNPNTALQKRVILHPGTWRLTNTWKFGPEDSDVTWRALNPGRATISGGQEITGWQIAKDGTWSVTLPEVAQGTAFVRELFINDQRAVRARTPNEGYFRVKKSGADRRTSFSFAEGDVKNVPDLHQVELVFLHDWSISRVKIKSIDELTSTLITQNNIGGSAPHYAIDHFEPHPRFYLEQSESYLDTPGEWFLNTKSGKLSYVPLPGQTPDKTTAVIPRVTQLIDVTGTPERQVSNLHFEGIHFEHCAWQIPPNGYAEGQANYHEPRTEDSGILRNLVPAAIRFELARNCSITDSRIAHMGGGGLSFGSRTHACSINRSQLTDLSGNGIMIGEDTTRIVQGKPWWQSAPEEAASENRVENCVIERCGRQFHGAVGVWAGLTQRTIIRKNEIHDLPYTGVSLGWMWNPTPTPNGNTVVEENHIHHVMQLLSDGGGIYTLGNQPGTVLRANHIHDIPVNLGRAESNGMFIDEGSTGITIEQNAIYNLDRSPLRFHRAGENWVRNNLLVVKEGIPRIRYNNTPEPNIKEHGNVIAQETERQP